MEQPDFILFFAYFDSIPVKIIATPKKQERTIRITCLIREAVVPKKFHTVKQKFLFGGTGETLKEFSLILPTIALYARAQIRILISTFIKKRLLFY